MVNDFTDETALIFSDYDLMHGKFTYITSWLDHCLSSVDAHNCINYISVLHDFVTLDHLPLSVSIVIPQLPQLCTNVTYNSVYNDLKPK